MTQATEAKQLTAKPYASGERFPVKDVDGSQLYEGDYVTVTAIDHNWVKQGSIIRTMRAQYLDVVKEGIAGVEYETHDRHRSSIRSNQIRRIEDQEDASKVFSKLWLTHRLAQLNASIARAMSERNEVEHELSRLSGTLTGETCPTCGHVVE